LNAGRSNGTIIFFWWKDGASKGIHDMLFSREFKAGLVYASLCGAVYVGKVGATITLTLQPAQGVNLSDLKVGTTYDLTLSALSDQSGEYFVAVNGSIVPDANYPVEAGFGGSSYADPQASNALTSDPTLFDITLTPMDAGTDVIFYDASYFASGGAYFQTNLATYYLNSNDLTFTAVPEPSTSALAAGLMGVILRRRKRS